MGASGRGMNVASDAVTSDWDPFDVDPEARSTTPTGPAPTAVGQGSPVVLARTGDRAFLVTVAFLTAAMGFAGYWLLASIRVRAGALESVAGMVSVVLAGGVVGFIVLVWSIVRLARSRRAMTVIGVLAAIFLPGVGLLLGSSVGLQSLGANVGGDVATLVGSGPATELLQWILSFLGRG